MAREVVVAKKGDDMEQACEKCGRTFEELTALENVRVRGGELTKEESACKDGEGHQLGPNS